MVRWCIYVYINVFKEIFRRYRSVVGDGGIPAEDFMGMDLSRLF